MITSDEKKISVCCYLLGVFGPIPTILILLVRGRDSSFIRAHAIEAVTLQINAFWIFVLLMLLLGPFLGAGPVVLPFIFFWLFVMIYGSCRAAKGKLFHCPFVLHFLGKPSKAEASKTTPSE